MTPAQRERVLAWTREYVEDYWPSEDGADERLRHDRRLELTGEWLPMPNEKASDAMGLVAQAVHRLPCQYNWHEIPIQGTGVFLHGPVGTGKTTAVRNGIALGFFRGWGLADDGKTATFQGQGLDPYAKKNFVPPLRVLDTASWMRALRTCWDEGAPKNERQLIEEPDTRGVLVIEDIGKEGRGGDDLRHRAYEGLIDLRLRQNRVTIVTTNLLPEEMADWVGARAWSRMQALCRDRMLAVTGIDMRLHGG